MTVIADASKARLIAVFIDHLIAFALMLTAVAFVPESLPLLKAVFFFLNLSRLFRSARSSLVPYVGEVFSGPCGAEA